MSLEASYENLRRWRAYPVQMVRELFDTEPDEWQKEALEAFASREPNKQRISLQACAGPGKTAVLAWIGWNFLLCYAEVGHHPNGACMSVSEDNLKDNLWKEFAVWQARSPLLTQTFKHTAERIFAVDHPKTWFLSARTWSKKANSEEQGRTLSGLHSKYILYLIDESGDISPAILRSAEQGLSNCAFGKIVQAGNPTSLDGMLHLAATRLRNQWYVIRITGDPDDPKRSPRISLEWASQQIAEYGRDNPWVMSFILGKFPPASINALLGVEEVEAAMARSIGEDGYFWAQKRLGVDVARFGNDRTVLAPRQGLKWFNPVTMRHNPLMDKPSVDIANRVMLSNYRWHQEVTYFDDTMGWAHGAIDICRAAGLHVIAINYGSKKTPDPRFYNQRAYFWFMMAQGIRNGACLPKIPELVRELTAPTYTYVNGQFLIEEKAQIKKRLGFSPDLADAYGETYSQPEAPADMTREFPNAVGYNQQNQHVGHDESRPSGAPPKHFA